jgi:GT2 family glycosyltransferase
MSDDAELKRLAEIFAEWIKAAPSIPAIYLFGSRVRGDHRPDSDVDVRLFLREWTKVSREDMKWWYDQDFADFRELKARLPGRLSLHREKQDDADPAIKAGRENPVLVRGRAICVRTPPKASFSAAFLQDMMGTPVPKNVPNPTLFPPVLDLPAAK